MFREPLVCHGRWRKSAVADGELHLGVRNFTNQIGAREDNLVGFNKYLAFDR